MRFGAHSISMRLTLLFSLAAVIFIASFALLILSELSSAYDVEHQRFMRDKIAELHTDLSDAHGHAQDVIAEIQRETADQAVRSYQARVLDAAGHLVVETPGMQSALPRQIFPLASDRPSRLRPYAFDQRTYALATWPLVVPGAPPLHVQIALNVSRDHRLLATFRDETLLAFLIMSGLLGLAGYAAASRGLAPVRKIVQATRQVSPQRLSDRIPLQPPWPEELTGLVEAFNSMLERLEDAFGRLSRFSADLAHELRTPLSNMRSALEVCLLKPRSEEAYRVALESNLEECRHLQALIDNLLFIARSEHAGMALRHETFDAREACAWVLEQHRSSAEAHGLELTIGGQAAIHADPVLFRLAVGNVLANAIHHSQVPGVVAVAVDEHGAYGTVTVIDHGVGIAREHLSHLTERFYQASATRSRMAKRGTGLGLAIVQSIMDLHGGMLEFDSEPGRGTRVTLHFPVAINAGVSVLS